MSTHEEFAVVACTLRSWHNGAVVLRQPPAAEQFEDYEFVFQQSGTVWPWFALERELVIRAWAGATDCLSAQTSPFRADGREADVCRWLQLTEQLICRHYFRDDILEPLLTALQQIKSDEGRAAQLRTLLRFVPQSHPGRMNVLFNGTLWVYDQMCLALPEENRWTLDEGMRLLLHDLPEQIGLPPLQVPCETEALEKRMRRFARTIRHGCEDETFVFLLSVVLERPLCRPDGRIDERARKDYDACSSRVDDLWNALDLPEPDY